MTRIAVADRRQALLDAATTVIARDGVAQATTRAIAAEAGMPLASLHYAFESRDAMFAALARSLIDSQHRRLAAVLERAVTLESVVHALPVAYLEYLRSDPQAELALGELVQWSRTVEGLGTVPAIVYSMYQESAESLLSLIEARFRVEWDKPRSEVARSLVAVADGVTARWLVDRDDDGALAVLTSLAHVVIRVARRA